jgi:hypothetical protein
VGDADDALVVALLAGLELAHRSKIALAGSMKVHCQTSGMRKSSWR